MDALGIVKEIFTIALAIKTAVETAQQNKAVCGQIGARVQVLTDIIRWLEEMEATKKPAMQASLKDLKEILDEALAQVKKCREKHIVSRLIKADSLSKDLQKVNQDIMDQMQIAHFAIAVNNSKQTALIVSRITSGVQLTLAKDAGQWEDSAHTEHSLLLGVPIPKRIKRFTFQQLQFATMGFSSHNLVVGVKDTSLIYKGVLDGRDVIIKWYTTPSPQSARQYIPDFQRLHQHESIVEILGYCIATSVETMSDRATCMSAQMSDSILVVEEYMPNGSLFDIFEERTLGELNWSTCFQIIRGIARGLEYIHAKRFMHLYLTDTNILLDTNMNPKLSGFGICQQMDHESKVSTQTIIEKLVSLKEDIPREYTKYDTVSMRTDLDNFGVSVSGVIKLCSRTEGWERLLKLLRRDIVEEDCFSDPSYSKLCHLSCDPSELKDIRRCILILLACCDLSVDITILDVLEMLDGNMQVLPQNYRSFMTSVLHGADIPSTCKRFTFLELKTATCDFSDDNLIRSVTSPLVYKGQLSDGRLVAIKDYTIEEGRKYLPDFQRMHQHENIVSILGYCTYTQMENMLDLSEARDHILVVEEYMPNGSLFDIWEGDKRPELDWRTAFGIIRGIAQGVAYIHANHFIYIYLNSLDILLDSDMNPKISGFRFSEELDHGNPKATQTVEKRDILSNMPAEYLADGVVSTRTDVYRFGKLVGYIIYNLSSAENWKRIVNLFGEGKTVDSSVSELCHHLRDSSDLEEIRKCIALCNDCTNPDSEDRPTMPDVVQMLDDLTTKPEVMKTLGDGTGNDKDNGTAKDDGTDVFKALSLRDY